MLLAMNQTIKRVREVAHELGSSVAVVVIIITTYVGTYERIMYT